MNSMNSFNFSQMALVLWLVLLILYAIIKVFRGKRGALSNTLCLNDIAILLITALVITLFYFFIPTLLTTILVIINLYTILLWLDALLFIQFRIDVNRQTIIWFLSGTKGLLKGVPYLLKGFKKYPWGAMLPVFLIWNTLTLINNGSLLWFFVVLSAYAYMALNTTQQWFIRASIAALIALSVYMTISYIQLDAFIWDVILIILVILIGVLSIISNKFQAAFFSTKSMIGNVFLSDDFIPNLELSLKSEHNKIINTTESTQCKSTYFARCQGANIILITMESLGAYIQPYVTSGAFSKISERFSSNSWISMNHYALCPNTTVATNQIYTGNYSNNPYNREQSDFPGIKPRHLDVLKEHGYKTLFLDSANLDLFNYYKLLNQIGFDKIWGTKDIPENGLRADYRLLNMIGDVVREIDNKPFFLHIINDQTHMPYELIDKKRFNKHTHRFSFDKGLYLDVVEEVDEIIDSFLTKLGQKIDLSNTIIAFTGDHGESFGEHGYSFHSNSIIPQQTQVPFMLNHRLLNSREIEHSCHFDIFPTFFDLLGIDYNYSCFGSSIALSDRKNNYFFHSATLQGNTPANFSLLIDDTIYWVDRLFKRTCEYNKDTHSLKTINASKKQYIETLLYYMLEKRRLIS